MRRTCFPAVVGVLDHIIANMASLGPGAELDMNNVTMRFALDVTGACEMLDMEHDVLHFP